MVRRLSNVPVLETVKLESREGEVFLVPRENLRLSTFLDSTLNGLNLEESIMDEPIKLDTVQSRTMRMIIEWLANNIGEQPPTPSNETIEWESKLKNATQMELCLLITASNYLEIRGLLERVCCEQAERMRDKTFEEVHRMFMMPEEFTAEEEEVLRSVHAWIDDDDDNE